MFFTRFYVPFLPKILLLGLFCIATAGCALWERADEAARGRAPKEGDQTGLSRLTVTVSGFRNDAGTARAALFRSADGFPNDSEKAFRRAVASIRSQDTVPRSDSDAVPIPVRAATFIFEDIPPGIYALAVLHDENDNGVQDTTERGIPTEGYGASNNPAAFFGPPSFASARFRSDPPETVLCVGLRYFF